LGGTYVKFVGHAVIFSQLSYLPIKFADEYFCIAERDVFKYGVVCKSVLFLKIKRNKYC